MMGCLWKCLQEWCIPFTILLPQMGWKQNCYRKSHWCLGKYCENFFRWDSQNQNNQKKITKLSMFEICNQWSCNSCEIQIFCWNSCRIEHVSCFYHAYKLMVPFIAQSLQDIIHWFASTFMLGEKLKKSACHYPISIPRLLLVSSF